MQRKERGLPKRQIEILIHIFKTSMTKIYFSPEYFCIDKTDPKTSIT